MSTKLSVKQAAPWHEPRNRTHAFRMACLVRGISAAEIAVALGVSRQAVSRVVRGEIRSKKIERALKRRFPDVFKRFPFGKHPPTVARGGSRGNCASVQGDKVRTAPTRRKACADEDQ